MPAMSQQPKQPATTTFQVAPNWRSATARLAIEAERIGLASVADTLHASDTKEEALTAAERCREHACGAQEALAHLHTITNSATVRHAITDAFGVMTAAISVADVLRANIGGTRRAAPWGEPGDEDAAATPEPCEAAS